MAIDIVQVFVRPDENVQWFHETFAQSHIDYVRTNFIDNGKLSSTKELSPDSMVLTITYSFTDQAALDEWTNDTYLQSKFLERQTYNQTNNIIEYY